MDFADAFEMAFIIKHDMEDIMKYNISMYMLTDSYSLFGVPTKSSTSREKTVNNQFKNH